MQLYNPKEGANMQATPIKKFEKISSETRDSKQLVVYKITDYKDGSIVYEVSDSGNKLFFKTLQEAKTHIKQIPPETARPLFRLETVKN
jgi:hypothetical protein